MATFSQTHFSNFDNLRDNPPTNTLHCNDGIPIEMNNSVSERTDGNNNHKLDEDDNVRKLNPQNNPKEGHDIKSSYENDSHQSKFPRVPDSLLQLPLFSQNFQKNNKNGKNNQNNQKNENNQKMKKMKKILQTLLIHHRKHR